MQRARGAFFDAQLHRELKKIVFKTILLRLGAGFVTWMAAAAWLFLLIVAWTAATSHPPLWLSVAAGRFAVVIAGVLFLVVVVYPLLRVPGPNRIAGELEKHRAFHDIVAAGHEFSERDDLGERYAPELIREVIREAVRSISGLQIRFVFLGRRQLAFVPAAYGALFVLVVLALATPGLVLEAGQRIITPTAVSAVAHDANLYASPGDVTVLAGADVRVSAVDFGGSDAPVTLTYNLAGGFWKTVPTEAQDAAVGSDSAFKQFSYTFDNVRNSLTYYFQSGTHKSSEYRIDVVHKPIVTDLRIVRTPPRYTGDAPDTLIGSGGNIQALEGTEIHVDARANNTLSSARVQFGDATPSDVDVSGRGFSFGFKALKDGTYSILLKDDLGHDTEEPLVYSIEVFRDNPPALDVLEPGGDAPLPRNLQLDVAFVASDDYGVSRAAIYFRKGNEEHYHRRSIELGDERGKREVASAFTWKLGNIDLFPGQFIEYFLEVEDNNIVTGPGKTKSRVFRVTVPTMAELYEHIEEENASRADLLEQARKEGQALKENVKKLSREFKKSQKLDWGQKKEIDKALASKDNIQQKLEGIQKSLDESLQALSDNKMTSQEIGEKLEEINRLLEDIDSEALNRYAEELRKAMEKLDPKQIQQALDQLEVTAEDLLKSLERTESLLKEIQREQQVEKLVRKTRDLMEAQEDLLEKTADTKAADEEGMKDLAGEQESLSEDARDLEKELEKTAGDMEDPKAAQEMQETSEAFSKQAPSKKMKQAAQQLGSAEKQPAMKNQQEALRDVIALFSKVVEMQAGMKRGGQRQTAENLQRLAKSTLDLSFRQERLAARMREKVSSGQDAGIRSLAVEQLTYVKGVQQIADELDEIAKKDIAVPSALLVLLGETIDGMRGALLFLEQSKGFMSTNRAESAVTSLNEITIELLSAAKNCSSRGGSGSGQQMSALQQLLNGQQQTLKESRALAQMRAMQEKMLQQRQAEIQRLAGRQRSLKQIAEDIRKSMKDGDRVLGRMDRTIERMEEVLRDLDSGVLDERTIRNEEHILSRLLDAQRSVHSRDYEKKRLSFTADDVFSNVTDGSRPGRTLQSLREEIRRAMALKAPGEFEDLIKLYFRALAEEVPLQGGDRSSR